jgi:hypothetical protein
MGVVQVEGLILRVRSEKHSPDFLLRIGREIAEVAKLRERVLDQVGQSIFEPNGGLFALRIDGLAGSIEVCAGKHRSQHRNQ